MPGVLRALLYRYTDMGSRVKCSKVLSTVTYMASLDCCTQELNIRLDNPVEWWMYTYQAVGGL